MSAPDATPQEAMTTVLLKFADGGFARATLPQAKLDWANEVRRSHGDEAYRACLRGLAAEYALKRSKETP